MTASDTQALITGAITNFGGAALVVLGALITLFVGLLVYRWGVKKLRGTAH